MVTLRRIVSKLIRGYRKTAVFAVTTRCNCRCVMCEMHKKKPESISLEDARRVLDFLWKHRFLTVYFTGGEPTMHPDILEMVRYADELGLITSLTTNGTSSKKNISGLKESGLYLLSVSLDHWEPDVCEKIRGYRNIKQLEEDAISYGEELGLRTYALAYLNPFLINDGVEKFINYVNHVLRVPFGFCYPTKCDVNTYHLNEDLSSTGELERKLEEAIRVILSMKRSGFSIVNAGVYLEDALRYSRSQTPNSYCRGGEDVVYVDWLGDVYPCFLKRKIFNILNSDRAAFLKNVKCNDCLINCFREPSIFPQALSSPRLFLKEAYYSYTVRDMIM